MYFIKKYLVHPIKYWSMQYQIRVGQVQTAFWPCKTNSAAACISKNPVFQTFIQKLKILVFYSKLVDIENGAIWFKTCFYRWREN